MHTGKDRSPWRAASGCLCTCAQITLMNWEVDSCLGESSRYPARSPDPPSLHSTWAPVEAVGWWCWWQWLQNDDHGGSGGTVVVVQQEQVAQPLRSKLKSKSRTSLVFQLIHGLWLTMNHNFHVPIHLYSSLEIWHHLDQYSDQILISLILK